MFTPVLVAVVPSLKRTLLIGECNGEDLGPVDGEDLGPRLSTYATPLRTALVRSIRRDVQASTRAADFYGALVRRCRDPDVKK